MSEFSRFLTRLREAAGHKSAREFYRVAGGRSAFGCTYKQYLNVEAGRHVPGPRLVAALVAVLRLWQDPDRSRRFAHAYLRALLGAGEAAEFITGALEAGAAPATPLRRAIDRDWAARSRPLTAAQSRLIRKDDAHYWAFTLLESDLGALSAEEMRERTGLPLAALERALVALGRAGLLAGGADGRWRCPDAGKIFIHERPVGGKLEVAPHLDELRRRWETMSRRDGKVLFDQYILVRASESEFKGYLPQLAQAVAGSEVYAATEGGEDTGFLLIESRVRRVMSF